MVISTDIRDSSPITQALGRRRRPFRHATETAPGGTDGWHLTAFAVYLAGMWTHWTITRSGRLDHWAGIARDYAARRLAQAAEASEN